LLFSGAIVPFDKLHKKITTSVYVPIIGDLMTSRWAYEALAVEQFKNNPFQKEFFDVEQKMSEASYHTSFLIPRLNLMVENLERNYNNESEERNNRWRLDILRNELDRLGRRSEVPFVFPVEKLTVDSFSLQVADEAKQYLEFVSSVMEEKLQEVSKERDQVYEALVEKMGSREAVLELRNQNHNRALSDLLLNRNMINKIEITRNRLIRKKDPIYMIPESRTGRAHLYAPVKRLGDKQIDTFWFNIVFIWITSLILYVILYFDLLKMLVNYFEGIRIRRRE
jgi:hypothetical protein